MNRKWKKDHSVSKHEERLPDCEGEFLLGKKSSEHALIASFPKTTQAMVHTEADAWPREKMLRPSMNGTLRSLLHPHVCVISVSSGGNGQQLQRWKQRAIPQSSWVSDLEKSRNWKRPRTQPGMQTKGDCGWEGHLVGPWAVAWLGTERPWQQFMGLCRSSVPWLCHDVRFQKCSIVMEKDTGTRNQVSILFWKVQENKCCKFSFSHSHCLSFKSSRWTSNKHYPSTLPNSSIIHNTQVFQNFWETVRYLWSQTQIFIRVPTSISKFKPNTQSSTNGR